MGLTGKEGSGKEKKKAAFAGNRDTTDNRKESVKTQKKKVPGKGEDG